MASRVFNPKRRLQNKPNLPFAGRPERATIVNLATPNAQAIDDETDQHQGANPPFPLGQPRAQHNLHAVDSPAHPKSHRPLPKKSFKKESLPSGARGHAPTKPPTGPVTTAPGIKSDQNVARGVRPPLEISVPPSLTLLLASRERRRRGSPRRGSVGSCGRPSFAATPPTFALLTGEGAIAPIAARGSRGKGRLSVRSPCQGHKRKKKRADAALGGPERRRRMSPRHASSPGERVGVARPSEKPPRSGHARAGSADGSPLPGFEVPCFGGEVAWRSPMR